MKSIYHLWAVLFLLVVTTVSCSSGYRGGWERVQLDKYEVTFGANGGEDVISVINYPTIRCVGIQNLIQDNAPADGIEVQIKDNELVINVSASAIQRSWKLSLDYYDAVCDPVYVYQK